MNQVIPTVVSLVLLGFPGGLLAAEVEDEQRFTYDFTQGSAGWSLGDDWSLGSWPPGGPALVGSAGGLARHDAGAGMLRSFACRLQMDRATAYFCVRFGNFDDLQGVAYSVCFEAMGAAVHRHQNGVADELAFAAFSIEGGLPHTVSVLTGDGSLDVFIDDTGAVGVSAADPSPGPVLLVAGPERTVVDDVEIVQGGDGAGHARAPRPIGELLQGGDVGPFVGGRVTGDVTLSGNQVVELSGGRYEVVDGNVFLTEDAALVIADDGALSFGVESSPLVHWGVHVSGNARFEVNGGRLEGLNAGGLMVADASGSASIVLRNCQTQLHILQAEGSSTVTLEGVRMVTPIGGQVAVAGSATVDITSSTIASIALDLSSGARLRADHLGWGQYLDDFDLQRDLEVSGVGYQLRIRDTLLHPSLMEDGANEKGWVLAASRDATLALADSELGKLNLGFGAGSDAVTVRGLRIGEPSDLSLGGIELSGVTVRQQWGFFVEGSRTITIEDSEGVWLFLFDTVDAVLRRSVMTEFDPRGYTGRVTFEDGRWLSGACEIIDANDFLVRGDVRTTRALLGCSWSESTMRRELAVVVKDGDGTPVSGAELMVGDGTTTLTSTTDDQGLATFTISCDDESRLVPWTVSGPGNASAMIDCLSSSPITVWTAGGPATRSGGDRRVSP